MMRSNFMRYVNFLTNMTGNCHLTGIAVIVLMLNVSLPANAANNEGSGAAWHTVSEITDTAENYVRHAVDPADSHIVPTARYLDPRLKLPRCGNGLEAFVRPGTELSGQIIVGVRCTGLKPWKVYVPVHVAVMQDVLVTRHHMPRGQRLQQQDVQLAARDVSGLVGGYLSQVSDILGYRLKRSVSKGVLIIPAFIQADVMINRGQSVTLVVSNATIDVRMPGKAMMDGSANQRIKVKNTRSGKIVEGFVRSAEQVEVLAW